MAITVTRDQLARFLPDNDTIRKFETLFKLVTVDNPQNLEIIFRLLEEVIISSGSAYASANMANAQLSKITDLLELLVVGPSVEPLPNPDNLAPPLQIGTMGEQQADRVRITGGSANGMTLGQTAAAAITGTTITGATVSSTGATSVGTLLNISAGTAGQIQFPATQNPSANANTLDDYEEGTWTPVVSFTTPGNLTVVYSAQVGTYVKIGRQVFINYMIQTSTFTHTTAAGAFVINGLPFTPTTVPQTPSKLDWQGIALAGITEISGVILSGSTQMQIIGSGSGLGRTNITPPNVPTGGTVNLIGQGHYLA